MPRRKMGFTELLDKLAPPTPSWGEPSEMRNELTKLVEQKVAEALRGDSGILQPFMQTRAVSNAIRANHNVIENEKFALYFADWGCMICGTKDARHCSLGMCPCCHGRIVGRMQRTLKKASAERPTFEEPKDLEAIAQEALAPSIEVLAKKRGRPARTWKLR